MSELYDFPMTLEEAKFIRDCLLDTKSIFYIGMKEKFSVEQKAMMDDLIDNLGTWIDNREISK